MTRNGFRLALCGVLAWVAGCSGPQPEPVPEHESFELVSAVLGETRRINVYVPPGYAGSRETYPVMYMPDGGVREDFPHVATTIDESIRAGRMQPLILVGIENTQRRYDLTPPTTVESDKSVAPRVGGATAFRRFLAEELKPHVARNFRAGDRSGIVGESLAALFILDTFFEQPDLFDTWIALSPSLWWNDAHLVKQADAVLSGREVPKNRIYLSHADETDIVPHAGRLADVLSRHTGEALEVLYVPRTDLTHATIYRAVAPDALPRMYPAE
ncbi:alpha/beta hydrolase-fold protein [Xanthomonadaceae bacterium JHOS43]|nr:alpha/beta hydrolase-fold protein [Xanthomonadaceae bacterium JHOS43]MCX7563407.1 alpha/beta hydrolase-fold protein [Xanthomonadaceae bacterium XH05]